MKGCNNCYYGKKIKDIKTQNETATFYGCLFSKTPLKEQPKVYQQYGCVLWRNKDGEEDTSDGRNKTRYYE